MFGKVSNSGVLQKGSKYHHETSTEIDVYALDVGNFRQGSVGTGHESGHGEHCGHTEGHARWTSIPIEPERHPGNNDNQTGWDVDLN